MIPLALRSQAYFPNPYFARDILGVAQRDPGMVQPGLISGIPSANPWLLAPTMGYRGHVEVSPKLGGPFWGSPS